MPREMITTGKFQLVFTLDVIWKLPYLEMAFTRNNNCFPNFDCTVFVIALVFNLCLLFFPPLVEHGIKQLSLISLVAPQLENRRDLNNNVPRAIPRRIVGFSKPPPPCAINSSDYHLSHSSASFRGSCARVFSLAIQPAGCDPWRPSVHSSGERSFPRGFPGVSPCAHGHTCWCFRDHGWLFFEWLRDCGPQ